MNGIAFNGLGAVLLMVLGAVLVFISTRSEVMTCRASSNLTKECSNGIAKKPPLICHSSEKSKARLRGPQMPDRLPTR